MKIICLILCTSALAAVFVTAQASETYFISPSGNDTANGLSAAKAWRSVVKVNATSFLPGDVIQFQRGGVWTEALKPKNGGTKEAPVIFTAFGEGERPLFVGSDEVQAAGTRIPTGGPVHAVLLDGAFLRTPGDFVIEKDTLVLTKPPAAGQRLRLIRRHNMVHLHHVEHVIVRGLAVDATAKMHAGYCFLADGCADVLFEDCAATRGGKHHFSVINSTEVTLRRCHASLVMPDQGVGGASAFVSYSDRSRKGDTSRYEECVTENYFDAGKGAYPAFVTHGEGIGSIAITKFTSKGAALTFNNRESGATLTFTDSIVEDAGVGLFGKGTVLKNITIKRGVLSLHGEENRAENCTIADYNPGFISHQSAVVNLGKRNVIKDCTISLAAAAKPFNAAIALVAPDSALTWEDCTFGPHGAAVRTSFPDIKAANCMARGNKYPATVTFMIKGTEKPLTLAQWQALGLDQK